MRRALGILLALAVACTPPTTAPSASPSGPAPSGSATPAPGGTAAAALPDMTAALLAKPLPVADVFELTRRMRGRDGQPATEFTPVRTTPPAEDVGTSKSFWTYDFAAKKNNRITATLRVMTEHAKWWVQDDITVDLTALRQNASFFESSTYPTSRRLYGSEWSPGVDADPRINIMVARIPGAAAGYFSSTDSLPLWVNEYSAEREMLYVNSLAARAGSSYLNSVVAHELCHMIQFGHRKRSAVWFNEGQAQFCEQENGFPVPHAQTFIQLPDTQLNDWPELEQSQPHYGGSHLFLDFLRQQAGGDALINAFLDKGIDTPADLDAVLRARGQKGIDEFYADFVAANAFIGQQADKAASYPRGAVARTAATAADQDRMSLGGKLASTVHSYAARYIELPRASATVKFSGAVRSKVVPLDPRSGANVWWSDRADGLDSRLTRTVDMTKATSPRLSFWTWYEIEKDYDYAYVAVSTDNGARWTTLPAPATTKDDPNGANLGNGFTGNSGGGDKATWVQQEVDLSAFAGKQIQLRFEYVTDGALSLHGFAVDDIQLPGVLSDDAESDTGWQAEGFVRSTNLVKQRYVVQLLRFTDRGATFERKFVEDGTLQLDFDASSDRRPPLLAVTGLAVRTTQASRFEVIVERR